jgi:N-ethylmaleimide reductase
MSQPKLLEPYKLGPITLPNRFVMAPLTRNRAVAGLVPSLFEGTGRRLAQGHGPRA